MKLDSMYADDLNLDADDLPPMGEIEYEEADGIDTALEVELLLGRTPGMRFSDA